MTTGVMSRTATRPCGAHDRPVLPSAVASPDRGGLALTSAGPLPREKASMGKKKEEKKDKDKSEKVIVDTGALRTAAAKFDEISGYMKPTVTQLKSATMPMGNFPDA